MRHALRLFIGYTSTVLLLWQVITCLETSPRLQFTNVANCEIKGLKILVEDYHMVHYNQETYLNIRFRAIENVKVLKEFQFHIERCNNQGYDCEDYQNLRIKRLCQMLAWKNQLWSDFVDRFKPALRCPLKKQTTYEVQNSPSNMEALLRWYPDLSKYRWKINFTMINEDDKVIYCVNGEAYIDQFRNHDRKPPRRPK